MLVRLYTRQSVRFILYVRMYAKLCLREYARIKV